MMLSVNNEPINEKTDENPHFRLLLRLSHRLSPIHRFKEFNLILYSLTLFVTPQTLRRWEEVDR